MKMDFISQPEPCKFSEFAVGQSSEVFFAFESPAGLDFQASVQALFDEYDELQKINGVGRESEIFLRFHLSDITNQAKALHQLISYRKHAASVSVVGQPPASGSKIALEAYHINARNPVLKELISENTLLVDHGSYTSIWSNCRPQQPGPSYQQTQQLFGALSNILHGREAKLNENVLRTWIYVRDVDNNYQGLVDARRELFEIVGMNQWTHYIASTGIEGCGEKPSDLILMDALSVSGIEQEQIKHINAPEFLCPTYEYNVTFERATRATYGDRSHFYISGTASIDREGNVLHVGDVKKQAERTVTNVNALLTQHGAELNDLKILIVYLRDISDTELIQDFLSNTIPESVPYIMVKGSVCRPLWLIEMEGIAVSTFSDSRFKPFC